MGPLFGFLSSKIFSKITCRVSDHLERRTIAFVSKEKNNNADSPFIIVRPDRDDYCCLLDLMWNAYSNDDPRMKYLNLGNRPSRVFNEYIRNALAQGLSLVAKSKCDGCIVGGAINEGTCPWDPELLEEFACTVSDPDMRHLFQFRAHVQRMPNLWWEARTPKIFELSYLFVRAEDRCQGLGGLLLQQSIETGADCGYRLVRFDAPSAQTARIADRQGMKLIHEVQYDTYLGSNGRPVINPPEPDTSVKIYVKTPFTIHCKN